MRRIGIVLIGLFSTSITTGVSSSQTLPSAEMPRTTAALLGVENHWTQAEIHGDVAYVAQLLLPRYESVNAYLNGRWHAVYSQHTAVKP